MTGVQTCALPIWDPELLILDEPTNGLDPQGICDMRDLLKRLQEERGMSILISSHMLAELDKVATDFVVIRSGKIIEQFTKEELLERCRDCFQLRVDDVKKASVILEETCFVQTYVIRLVSFTLQRKNRSNVCTRNPE